MTEVSARLRAARERAGLTIADVAASTRIRPAALEAIERGDFASLPGVFYTRAFLRTYASHVGLPAQEVVDAYDAERPPPAQPHVLPQPVWQSTARRAGSQFMAAATSTGVVIALVVGLLALAIARSTPDTPSSETGAVGTVGSTASAPTPARSGGTASPPAPASPQTLTIDIQAGAALWVTGAADGKRVLYRLLAPGERVSIQAKESLAFRVGDASAFTYSINGVAGKPIGGPGEVRDIEITRANLASYRR